MYHNMRRNSNTIDRESSVKLEWSSKLECLKETIHGASVWILSLGIRLHFLNLSFDIIKWKTTSCSEKS
jgi:hypothetical protein